MQGPPGVAVEPRVLVFACNWCAYAAADLAGTSRLRYPPNARVVRLMCTGMLDPGYVWQALERGFDGVMVSGCHPGDCHYIDGNLKAEGVVERIHRVLDILGLGTERVRLQWISTSEGIVFAETVTEFVESLRKLGPSPLRQLMREPEEAAVDVASELEEALRASGAFNCLECGKCTSICPVASYNPGYSPRKMVEEALLGLEDDLIHAPSLFSCLTCAACSTFCPSEVDFPLFIRGVRGIAAKEEECGHCAHSGVFQSLARLMARSPVKQNRLDWVSEDMQVAEQEEVLLFVGCAPYFEPEFEEMDYHPLEISKASVRLLNRIGITPVVLPDERCCGHDALWMGDKDTFRRLAERNAAMIRESGAKKILFSCPECYRTFMKDYPAYVDMDCEMQHISEFLAEMIDAGDLKLNEVKRKVTYQDPCRLGRHLGLYEPPRKVLEAIPGLELVEMPQNRERAICCGTTAWTNCDAASKQMRVDRLLEAKGTSADLLATACPKCQIHFRCAMVNEGTEKGPDIHMDTADLISLVMEALGDDERGE